MFPFCDRNTKKAMTSNTFFAVLTVKLPFYQFRERKKTNCKKKILPTNPTIFSLGRRRETFNILSFGLTLAC